MAKEYKWTIEIDGKERTVICLSRNNEYAIYVDDDYLQSIYCKQSGKVDEKIEICGKPCHLVIANGFVDLVYNGYMINKEMYYEIFKKKERKSDIIAGFALIVLGILGVIFVCFNYVSDTEPQFIVISLFVPAAFLMSGIIKIVNTSSNDEKW